MLVFAAMGLFYMADTAITTWGPTYRDKQVLASASMVSVATLPYLAASLVGRGAGDMLARRYTLLLQQQRVPATAAFAGGVCV